MKDKAPTTHLPPPVDLTMPEDCPLCHKCGEPISPLHNWRVNDAGYKVHAFCKGKAWDRP